MNDPIEKFYLAVSSENVHEVFNSIMYDGVNVMVERRGQTALHETLSEEIAQYLIDEGANVNQHNLIGRTPLHSASGVGCISVVNILIRERAGVNNSDIYGWTPLHLASNQGQVEVIYALLENHANVNAVDEHGLTPLHMTFCRKGDVVTDILIRNKADVNATDNYGMTPLHVAAGLENSVEVINVLLRHNADKNVADNSGKTPLDLAKNENKYILNHNPYSNMYIQEKGQTGLALIVNYTERRPGSDEDVKKMKHFFKHTLVYDVRVVEDKDEKQLMEFFESIKNNEMKRKATAYHCFVLVMMCHGNQDRFKICDGSVKVKDIVNQFKHVDFPGKPKYFIFQSCRELQAEPVTKNASQQTDNMATIGEMLDKTALNLHEDSDRLVSFATTSGHFAYRNPEPNNKPWIGAYFVHALLDVFSKNYKTKHVVDMLQVVRRKLNKEDHFKTDGVTCQMSEDQSTLDGTFYL